MIDRIRLTAAAKNQLSTLKRRTGIEHYNSICRHALCLSLRHSSMPPNENFNFAGGLEIDWRTLTGGNEDLYVNLVLSSLLCSGDGEGIEVKDILVRHIHRGLSLMMSQDNGSIFS
ncbi:MULTISPECIES: DNA sulfur modification protein DndE [Pseudomonas]|uniref:DNA sulfur modification protein DndE n=1 Tax=Pseudomonas TaxID=286 RepID=UPI000CD0B153|nr:MULTISPECIES: DNA sulfur modification protein DndE [unclassified Pseudomonas]POA57762.1 DNA sulfur modification protein DndE [Pseudomonas sp. FW507-12TSA]